MQEERVGAADVAPLDDLAEHVDAALQRRAERLLLAPDDLLHGLAVRDDLGIGRAHDLHRGVDHGGQHEIARAEHVGVQHRAG